MRKPWIIPLLVLFVGIVAATITSLYLVHSDLTTLSLEVTSLGERVSALEEKQSSSTLAAIEPHLSPRAHLEPSTSSLVSEHLGRELGLGNEQSGEINRLISNFFVRETAYLAVTTRTASGQVEMTIRTDDLYRREREERWRQFLAKEIAPRLTREQMDRLSRSLSPGAANTTETVQIRW